MDKIGIGVLGWAHGHIGAYANQIRNFPDAELTVGWDHDAERAAQNAAQFGMTDAPTVNAVLEDSRTACVMIGAETNRHADLCEAAAMAGKGILLQKPLALTLADCDRIIAVVAASGVWFSVAYQMRLDPQNIRMKELVREGAVGRVGIVRRRHSIGMLFSKGFVEGKTRWHFSREANRGMWMDDASHPCDWLTWMFGKPVSVIAEIDNVLTAIAPDDAGFAIFRYADGKMAEVHNASVTLASENTTEIYGDKGVIIQNHGDSPSCSVKPPHPVGVKLYQTAHPERGWQDLGIPVPAAHGERIAGVARPFVDALKAGTTLCSAEEARISVEMVLAAYESAESGRRISLA